MIQRSWERRNKGEGREKGKKKGRGQNYIPDFYVY